ncbi:MAG: nicotinamide-nucleotide adenylyltransferase [Candidatus Odinarchaeota archaeon]
MVVGLIIGRFQPPHKGHINAIKNLLKKVDMLIIGVGSAQKCYFQNNPFTAGERISMLKAALEEASVEYSKYMLIPIQDVDDNRLWVYHVVSLVPRFDIVYTNDRLSNYLFKHAGFDARFFEEYDRSVYSSTEVRRRMKDDGDWRSLVPESIAKIIDEIKGVERVKFIEAQSLK